MNTQRMNKCTFEGEHEACTHMQGCGESREENAEPAPKGLNQKLGVGDSDAIVRRVFSVTEHREAWARGF